MSKTNRLNTSWGDPVESKFNSGKYNQLLQLGTVICLIATAISTGNLYIYEARDT